MGTLQKSAAGYWPIHAPEVGKECVLQAFYISDCAQVQTGD